MLTCFREHILSKHYDTPGSPSEVITGEDSPPYEKIAPKTSALKQLLDEIKTESASSSLLYKPISMNPSLVSQARTTGAGNSPSNLSKFKEMEKQKENKAKITFNLPSTQPENYDIMQNELQVLQNKILNLENKLNSEGSLSKQILQDEKENLYITKPKSRKKEAYNFSFKNTLDSKHAFHDSNTNQEHQKSSKTQKASRSIIERVKNTKKSRKQDSDINPNDSHTKLTLKSPSTSKSGLQISDLRSGAHSRSKSNSRLQRKKSTSKTKSKSKSKSRKQREGDFSEPKLSQRNLMRFAQRDASAKRGRRKGSVASRNSIESGGSRRSRSRSIRSRASHSSEFFESLLQSKNLNDKYIAVKNYNDQLKSQLIAERQKNYNLNNQLQKFEKQFNTRKNVYEELKNIKDDYAQLMTSFEKSERIRKDQKQLILQLREEIDIQNQKQKQKTKKVIDNSLTLKMKHPKITVFDKNSKKMKTKKRPKLIK